MSPVTLRVVVQRFTRMLAWGGMVMLLPMMFLTSADVILRKTVSITIPGTMELSSYALALFVLLGLSYTHQVRAHVRISFFVERLPVKAQAVIDIFLNLLILAMLIVLMVEGWKVAVEETTVSDMLRIPQAPFRMVLVLACFSFVLEILLDISTAFHRLRAH